MRITAVTPGLCQVPGPIALKVPNAPAGVREGIDDHSHVGLEDTTTIACLLRGAKAGYAGNHPDDPYVWYMQCIDRGAILGLLAARIWPLILILTRRVQVGGHQSLARIF